MFQPSSQLQQTFEFAKQVHSAGHWAEAEKIYRQILAVDPWHADSLQMLGVLASQAGRPEIAVDLIRRAVEINPKSSEYRNNLGSALAFLKHYEDAAAELRVAVELDPKCSGTFNNLGNVLGEMGRYDEAMATLRHGIELAPREAMGYFNLGNLYREMDQLEQSVKLYDQALTLDPKYLEALNNLGNVYYNVGKFDQALDCWQKLFAIDPNHALAHWNASFVYLMRGDYQKGWEEYEWRMKTHGSRVFPPDFPRPMWKGEEISGKRILLYAEQAFGDTLNFVRYVPLVAKRGAQVILGVPRPLVEALRNVPGVGEIMDSDQRMPDFDFHCPLPSLPRIFGTTLENIPPDVPYVHADTQKMEHWKTRVADEMRLKVGMVWAGRPFPRNRFITPELLAPLGKISSIRFYSLQKSDGAQPTHVPPGIEMTDWTAELKDFSDTAAFMANLDLILTVDTAVAHLAGAMGLPTWVMLKFVPDWRWMMGRADSPWYPTIRLFRQPKLGDWASLIEQVTHALQEKCDER